MDFGLGPVWGPKGPWKNMVLLGDGSEGQVGKVSRGANDSPGPWQPFGQARTPKNPQKPQFWVTFGVSGVLGQGPWQAPISPLWANRALFGTLNYLGPWTIWDAGPMMMPACESKLGMAHS